MSTAIAQLSILQNVRLQSKFLLATANAKHLAGFMLAPVYPIAAPVDEKLTRPSDMPTSRGPSEGPKSACWRGSRPTPKAKKLARAR